MRRAYSYVRFSKKDQASGDSLRRQLAASEAYCKRKGLQLDEGLRLHDLGISAFQGKNAAVGSLGTFLDAVRIGRVPKGSVLIIESLDRLSRSEMGDAYDLFRGLLKAGIDIATLTPEHEYTKANANDIIGLLEPLFIMSRAHEESATKSVRLRAMWQAKRDRMHEEAATTICPAWLRPKTHGKGFEPIPEAVQAVLRIHKLAREGHGISGIVGQLKRDGIAPIARRSTGWSGFYVGDLLRTRAVIGEYQPHVIRNGKRVPQGDSIPHYYPAIMSEKDWYKTRSAVKRRSVQRGPQGKKVGNLFTGIMFDARDGCTMVLRAKGADRKGYYILSSGSIFGKKDTPYVFFPYDPIETTFLAFLGKELAAELLGKRQDGQEEKIAGLTGKLLDLDSRIQAVQRAIEDEPDYESQLVLMRRLENKKRATSAELEKVRQEQTSNEAETLGEARSIHAMLSKCPPEELADLRIRLKARIRSLVESIWVLPEGERRRKVASVQVFFRSGKWVRFIVYHPHHGGALVAYGNETTGPETKDDLRQWRKLEIKPSFFPATRPSGPILTDEGQEFIKELHRRIKDAKGRV